MSILGHCWGTWSNGNHRADCVAEILIKKKKVWLTLTKDGLNRAVHAGFHHLTVFSLPGISTCLSLCVTLRLAPTSTTLLLCQTTMEEWEGVTVSQHLFYTMKFPLCSLWCQLLVAVCLAFKHEHSMCQQMGCSVSHSVSKDAAFG